MRQWQNCVQLHSWRDSWGLLATTRGLLATTGYAVPHAYLNEYSAKHA